MTIFWRTLFAVLFISSHVASATADELPKILSLQCEGVIKLMMEFAHGKPKFHFEDGTFNITIQLEAGSVFDITHNVLLGKDCILENGDVKCEFNHTSREYNSITTRHGILMLNRETGSLQMLFIDLVFDGQSATGTPSAKSTLKRTGICRKGQRIF